MPSFPRIPLADLAIRREIWRSAIPFSSASTNGSSSHYGGGPRSMALLSMFFIPGHVWRQGYLIDRESLASAQLAGIPLPEWYLEKNWPHPLSLAGELGEEAFLRSNPAVRAFREALEKSMRLAKHEAAEADRIIEEASLRVYPDYAARIETLGKMLLEQSDNPEPFPKSFPPFFPEAPLFSMPKDAAPDFVQLALEALEMPRKSAEKDISSAAGKAHLEETRKWAEKWRAAIRKQFPNH